MNTSFGKFDEYSLNTLQQAIVLIFYFILLVFEAEVLLTAFIHLNHKGSYANGASFTCHLTVTSITLSIERIRIHMDAMIGIFTYILKYLLTKYLPKQ